MAAAARRAPLVGRQRNREHAVQCDAAVSAQDGISDGLAAWLAGLADARDWKAAVSELEAAEGPSPEAISEALRACKRAASRDRNAGKGAQRAIKASPNGVRSLKPDALTSAITALGRSRQWNRLEELWQEAMEAGVETPGAAFCAMAAFADRRKEPAKALSYASAMTERGIPLDFGGASVFLKIFGRGVAPLWEDLLLALCQGEEAPRISLKELFAALASVSRAGVSNRKLLRRTIEWASAHFEHDLCHDEVASNCLEAAARLGDWKRALALVDFFASKKGNDGLPDGAYLQAVRAARVARNPNGAFKALDAMRSVGAQPDALVLREAGNCCSLAGDAKRARHVLHLAEGQSEEVTNELRERLISSLARRNRWREALSELERGNRAQLSSREAATRLAIAAARASKSEGLQQVVEELGDSLSNADIAPALAALDEAGESDGATTIAHARGLSLQEQAIRLRCLADSGKASVDTALAVADSITGLDLDRLQARGPGQTHDDGKLRVTVRGDEGGQEPQVEPSSIPGVVAVLEAAINAAAMAGRHEEASARVDAISSLGVLASQEAGSALLRAASQNGLEEVREAAGKAQKACGGLDVEGWNIVLRAFAARGRWLEAFKTYEQMDAAGLIPTSGTWSALALAAERSGQWKVAADVIAGELRLIGDIAGYYLADFCGRALHCWIGADAKAASTAIEESVYCSCIRSAARSGQWEAVQAYLDDMRSEGVYPAGDAYFELIREAMRARQANLLGQAMADVVNGSSGVHARMWELCIEAHGVLNDFDRASQLLEELKRAGKATWRAYAKSIQAAGTCGRSDCARAVFDDMQSAGLPAFGQPHAALIRAYGNAGEPETALQAFREGPFSANALQAIMAVLGDAGHWQEATAIVKEVCLRVACGAEDHINLSFLVPSVASR